MKAVPLLKTSWQISPPRSSASRWAVSRSVPAAARTTSCLSPPSSRARTPIWASAALPTDASTWFSTSSISSVEVTAVSPSIRLPSSQIIILLESNSSALLSATTAWLARVERTRVSSSLHSRRSGLKTARVPQKVCWLVIGTQSAPRSPAARRSGGPPARSKESATSVTASGCRLSATAPITPWPLLISLPTKARGKPRTAMTRLRSSPIAWVSSAWVPPPRRAATSSVFCSSAAVPWVVVVRAWEISLSESSAEVTLSAWPDTFLRIREFSTATPAMAPSSWRAGMSLSPKPMPPLRPRQSAPKIPSRPEIGASASATWAVSEPGSTPLKSPSERVTRRRITVLPSFFTSASGLFPRSEPTADPPTIR